MIIVQTERGDKMDDLISKQAAIDMFQNLAYDDWNQGVLTTRANAFSESADMIKSLPSAQTEDYTELKREFLRMASYIDVLLECSDEQKETLIGFISRLAEFMPWTERD